MLLRIRNSTLFTKDFAMPTPAEDLQNIDTNPEPTGLRLLRILTVVMTIVMIIGFVTIVSLLSIALNKNINKQQELKTLNDISISKNERLSAVTYSEKYTILLLTNEENNQFLRLISNKTGKVLSNIIVSDLVTNE